MAGERTKGVSHVRDILREFLDHNFVSGLSTVKPKKNKKINFKAYKMLSNRRETTLQGALWFSPNVEDWNWETIFYGHYRSISNHCDISGLKICRIR